MGRIEAKPQRARSFATLVLFGIAAVVLLAMALAELSSEWQRSSVVQTSQLASSARTTFSDFGLGVEWFPDAMMNPSEGNERPRTLTEVLQESDTYATSTSPDSVVCSDSRRLRVQSKTRLMRLTRPGPFRPCWHRPCWLHFLHGPASRRASMTNKHSPMTSSEK